MFTTKSEILIYFMYSGNAWYHSIQNLLSSDSSIGIATGWMIGVRFPAGAGNFSRLYVQTGSGVNPASYPMGIVSSFPVGKAAEA
jgi:hypothetical protein